MFKFIKLILDDGSSVLNLVFVSIILGLYQHQLNIIKENGLLKQQLISNESAIRSLEDSLRNQNIDLKLMKLQSGETGASIITLSNDANFFYNGVAIVAGISVFLFAIYLFSGPSHDEKLNTLFDSIHNTISTQNTAINDNNVQFVETLSKALEHEKLIAIHTHDRLDCIHHILCNMDQKITNLTCVADSLLKAQAVPGHQFGASVEEIATSVITNPYHSVIQSMFDSGV